MEQSSMKTREDFLHMLRYIRRRPLTGGVVKTKKYKTSGGRQT